MDALEKRNLNIIFLLKNKLLSLAAAIFLFKGLDCNRFPSLNRATAISRALDRAVVITIANSFDDIDEFFTVAATVLTFLHSVNAMAGAKAALLDAFAILATAEAGATAFASALTTWAQEFASLSAPELGRATAALTVLAVIARLSAERAIAVDANTARVIAPINFTFSFGFNLSSSRQL